MHSTETSFLAGSLAALFVGLAALFVTTRRDHSLECLDLIHRLHPHQLRGITDLIDYEVEGRIFWGRTHGCAGLWRRWRNHTVLVKICQGSGWSGAIPPEEMEYIMTRAMALTEASLAALFYGLLVSLMPDMAAKKGRRALRLYSEIAFRTHTFCADEGAPLCASVLASVL